MRRAYRAAAGLVFCLLMSVRAEAATFVDDMTDYWNNSFTSYHHLAYPQKPNYYARMADRTALSFASPSSPRGWAEYTVTGAETISVTLYSQVGTFVNLAKTGRYILGVDGDNPAGAYQGRALYSPAFRGVYARIGGELRRAYIDEEDVYSYVFEKPDGGVAPADLTEYGVNIYAMLPGFAFRKLTLTVAEVYYMPESGLCREILAAEIPIGTTAIRVELNDVSGFPVLGSLENLEPDPKDTGLANALASVTLVGDRMIFGPPAPVVTPPPTAPAETTEPTEPTEPPRSSSRSSSRASSSRPSSSRAGSGTTSPSSPSSKFTGVIEAPPRSEKFTGVISAPSVAKAAEKPTEKSAEEPREKPETEPREEEGAPSVVNEQPSAVLYQIGEDEGAAQPDNASAWIIAYAIGLTGALLALLLKKRK